MTQPDTIVPNPYNSQDYDRYAYVRNNPVRYTDPTGHCIGLISCFLTATGILPDFQGIANVILWTDTDDAVVAAGIAVQSEFPTGTFFGDANGLAQVKESEMMELGVEGQNIYNPEVAVQAMENRISNAIDACRSCNTDTDRLILAAIAQNGGISTDDIPFLPITADGSIDWARVLNEWGGNSSDSVARIRQDIVNMNYDTKFMVKIYMQDLEILMGLGYELSDEFDDANFNIINDYITPETNSGNNRFHPIPN